MCIRDSQEYNITWEYVPGKQNTVADALSRVNLENGTFEIVREDVGKICLVISAREELVKVLTKIQEEQAKDQRLSTIQAVSYTHLDVYKRQGYYCTCKAFIKISRLPRCLVSSPNNT